MMFSRLLLIAYYQGTPIKNVTELDLISNYILVLSRI